MGRASRTKRERRAGDGDCYDKAVEVMMGIHPAARPYARLCHGRVTGNAGAALGRRYGHAWVEVAEAVVLDKSNGHDTTMLRERYYSIAQIDPSEVVRYDYDAMSRALLDTRHYGPWATET